MERAVEGFDAAFEAEYIRLMRLKLGLATPADGDAELVSGLFAAMEASGADFTETFKCISRDDGDFDAFFRSIEGALASAQDLKDAARPSMSPQQLRAMIEVAERQPSMLGMFGVSIGTINTEIRKLKRAHDLRDLTEEGKRAADRAAWEGWFARYRARVAQDLAGGDAAGRGGDGGGDAAASRRETMRRANPKNVLRNHVAQRVIERAEAGDFSDCRRVLALMRRPFDDGAGAGADGAADAAYCGLAPAGTPAIVVT